MSTGEDKRDRARTNGGEDKRGEDKRDRSNYCALPSLDFFDVNN
jgi:hypothetical protein